MSISIPYRLANGAGNPPDGERLMANLDWLTAILFGSFVSNGGMENWNDATSYTNPATGIVIADDWTYRKSGTSTPTANVAREATIVDSGVYSGNMNITVAGSANSLIAFDQVLPQSVALRGKTVCLGGRIKAGTGNKVRLKITDGSSTVYSNYHDGSGAFEQLDAVITISSSATSVTISVEMISDVTGNIYADGIYVFIIPASMTATARASLAWDPFLED